jgi:prepilin signal peptidase PulO-like enzyme (type II secretory pathway)
MSTFSLIRRVTVVSFIVSTVVLTFLSILSIWEIAPRAVLGKSLGSLGVLVLSTIIIVLATLDRDGILVNKRLTLRQIILYFMLGWILFWFLSFTFNNF